MSALRKEEIYAEQPVDKPRRYAVPQTRRKRSDLGPWRRLLLLLVGIVILVFFQLTGYAVETNLSFQLEEKQKKLDTALSSTERLRMEIHRENSLESLEERAQALGFRPATNDQYVHIQK